MASKWKISLLAIMIVAIVAILIALEGGKLSSLVNFILSPPSDLSIGTIIAISLILGMLHGATPDEHTWPITFSYAVGSYSTRKGMKAGFVFSSGFTIQRAILTTLGFIGLAAIYKTYNLDGPVYVIVGIVMAIAGAYILNKRKYLHLPLDIIFKGKKHHSDFAQRMPLHESEVKEVPVRMAFVHGLIAGWGFGAYASIITFILAPQVPGLIYAPLPGLFFGIGTMIMQIIFGAMFANIGKRRQLSEEQIKYIGRKTAGRTLYYGGFLFAIIGALIIFFPVLDNVAISTGLVIPNLDSIGVATVLVLGVVGIIGIGNLVLGIREMLKTGGKAKKTD